MSSATQEQLGEVATGLNDLMHQVAQLRYAVESEVKGEPADKAQAQGLLDKFGLEAEQYLGEQPHGTYSDAEVMALGLYTNGEYQHLNRSLRQEQPLDAGQALVDQGMSAAFEKSTPAEQLVKTFRGTRGGDAFSGVAEGKSVMMPLIFPPLGIPRWQPTLVVQAPYPRYLAARGSMSATYPLKVTSRRSSITKRRICGYCSVPKMSGASTGGYWKRPRWESRAATARGCWTGWIWQEALGAVDKPQEQDIRLKMRGLDLA